MGWLGYRSAVRRNLSPWSIDLASRSRVQGTLIILGHLPHGLEWRETFNGLSQMLIPSPSLSSSAGRLSQCPVNHSAPIRQPAAQPPEPPVEPGLLACGSGRCGWHLRAKPDLPSSQAPLFVFWMRMSAIDCSKISGHVMVLPRSDHS